MYNRYIPQPDGSYRRNRVDEPRQPEPRRNPHPSGQKSCPPAPSIPETPPKQSCSTKPEPPRRTPPCRQEKPAGGFLKNLLPRDLDTGDLMVILLLLLISSDCEEDRNNALLTLAIYLFM